MLMYNYVQLSFYSGSIVISVCMCFLVVFFVFFSFSFLVYCCTSLILNKINKILIVEFAYVMYICSVSKQKSHTPVTSSFTHRATNSLMASKPLADQL